MATPPPKEEVAFWAAVVGSSPRVDVFLHDGRKVTGQLKAVDPMRRFGVLLLDDQSKRRFLFENVAEMHTTNVRSDAHNTTKESR